MNNKTSFLVLPEGAEIVSDIKEAVKIMQHEIMANECFEMPDIGISDVAHYYMEKYGFDEEFIFDITCAFYGYLKRANASR